MKMKKWLALALALCLVTGLCACTKPAEEAPQTPAQEDVQTPEQEDTERVLTSEKVDAALYVDAEYAGGVVSDADFELFIPATEQTFDFSSAVWCFFDTTQAAYGKDGLVWAITACPIEGLETVLREDNNNKDLCFAVNCHILGTDSQTVYMISNINPSDRAVWQYDGDDPRSAASYLAHAEAGKKILEDFVQKNALDVPDRASDWSAWYDKWMLGRIALPSFTGGITLYAGNDTALVNSEPVKMESAPFIENDAFYIPLQFVAETMGWDYQQEGGTVHLQHGYHWTELTVGTQAICVDGVEANVLSAAAPVEKGGVLFLPLDYLGTRTDNDVRSSLGFYSQLFAEEGYAILCGSGKEDGIGGFYVFDVYDELPEAQRAPMQELGVVGVSREAYDVVEYGADGLFVHVLRLKEGCENEDQLDGLISAVYTTNPDYPTPRGLRVGERISRIYTTYDANFHMHFLCITEDGVITRIRFNSYYDEDANIRTQPTCLHMDAAEAAGKVLSTFSSERPACALDIATGSIKMTRPDGEEVRFPLPEELAEGVAQFDETDIRLYEEAIACAAEDARMMLFVPPLPFEGAAAVACSEDGGRTWSESVVQDTYGTEITGGYLGEIPGGGTWLVVRGSIGAGMVSHTLYCKQAGGDWARYDAFDTMEPRALDYVAFLPDGSAFISVGAGWDGRFPFVYCSRDGGVTWQACTIDSAREDAYVRIDSITSSADGLLMQCHVATEENPEPEIYVSTDGRTWDPA